MTYAFALLRTRFVVITPESASDVPWPVIELPPDESDVLSADERITACSFAVTLTFAAVTVALWMYAIVSPRTSLRTTMPAIPADGDCVRLKPEGRSSVPVTGFQKPRSV